MPERSSTPAPSSAQGADSAQAKARAPTSHTAEASSLADKLDPTTSAQPSQDGGEPPPTVEETVRGARGSLPAALLRRFIDADLMSQSAALALYAILSLVPLLLILVWLTSTLVAGAQEALLEQIGQLVGTEAQDVARNIIDNARDRPDTGSIAGWWSVLLLMVGATTVFAQLQDVLNRIFRTDPTQLSGVMAWLRKRVFSLGLVLAVGFLLLVSMTVSTVLQLAFARVEWMLPVMAGFAIWLMYALGFALMYRYLPDRPVSWSRALAGGAATALLFVLGRLAIGWYLDNTDPGSAYGSMGTLVMMLIWIYYAALIVFVGALLTAVFDERAKDRALAS